VAVPDLLRERSLRHLRCPPDRESFATSARRLPRCWLKPPARSCSI
jgi:hypothetical protein